MSCCNTEFCESCCMPLDNPENRRNSSNYCIHCSDENGNLKSWDEILMGATGFIQSWQKVSHEEAQKRAIRMLSSMPAWAEKIIPK